MTGFGRAGGTIRNHQIRVEIKSVNSKFTEYRFRLPAFIRDKEFEIRKVLSAAIDRGKIDFMVEQSQVEQDEIQINTALFNKYATTLKELSEAAGLKNEPLIPSILNLPNVVETSEVSLNDEEWIEAEKIINQAIIEFNAFRLHEGKMTADVIKQNVLAIQKYLIDRKSVV